MKRNLGYLLLVCIAIGVQAQEVPYYQAPRNRELINNEIALPNLKTEKIYWYVSGNTGIKIAGKKLESSLGGEVLAKNILNTFWEGYFGINNNDKWQIELGYIGDPLSLKWQLIDKRTDNPIAPFKVARTESTIALRFKKRLLTLDRVTKNSRINAIGGIQYTLGRQNENITEFNFRQPTLFTRGGFEDTIYVTGGFNQKAAPLAAEIGFEIIGRLATPIEIGFFTKYIINSREVLSSQIDIDSYYGEPRSTKLFLNGSNLMLGVTLRWNFLSGIRYLPDIN
ncbi:MAG: hypothetical protein ACI9IP_001412 [Arcticibacterium sp.]|jgi:hypothetical protein